MDLLRPPWPRPRLASPQVNPTDSSWRWFGMSRSFTCAVVALCALVGAVRADWQDELTHTPGTFAPLPPLKAHYRFGWAAFTAAEGDFEFSRPKKDITRLAVTAQSIGVVRSMWRMNVENVSTMQTSTFRPISMVQTEIYKNETQKTKVDFSAT